MENNVGTENTTQAFYTVSQKTSPTFSTVT